MSRRAHRASLTPAGNVEKKYADAVGGMGGLGSSWKTLSLGTICVYSHRLTLIVINNETKVPVA